MANKIESIIFIDASVESPEQLAAGVAFDAEVLVLSPTKDGVEQITFAIASHPDVSEIYIVAHGSPGEISLGNTKLGLNSLSNYSDFLRQWASSNQPKNLYIYSCNVAAGDAGAEFLAQLQSLTQTNVAASTQLVGHANRGSSWDLDTAIGDICTQRPFTDQTMAKYSGVLAGEDLFADAVAGTGLTLVDGTVSDTDDTTTATSEPNEPIHDTSVSNLDPNFQAQLNDSIWWKWTAPTSGLINATTTGSAIDAIVAVYTGTSLTNLSSVSNTESTTGESSSSFTFTASAGTTYYFAVDGVNDQQGAVQLTLNVPPQITEPGSPLTVSEGAGDGATVGTIAVSKPVTWSITGGNPDNNGDGVEAFAIDNNGVITVQDADDLDFETFDSFYSLEVTADDGSFVDTASVAIEVTDAPEAPINLSLSSPSSVNEGSLITLSGQFFDPDAGDTQTITVVWGDGTANTVISSDGLPTDAEGNTLFAVNHVYRDNGNYPVSVSVSDSTVGTPEPDVTATANIVVNNVAPTITTGESLVLNVNEDADISFQLKATDPSAADTLTYSVVDAPNNGALNPNPPATPTGPSDRNRSFTYSPNDDFNGTDTFQIQVQDDDGGIDTIDVTVNVLPQPDAPENLILGPTSAVIDEGEIFTLNGSFEDPDSGDSFTVTINWGDDTENTVLTDEDLTFNAASGQYSFSADHLFLDDTASGILVTVEDSSGAIANQLLGITVNNLAPTLTPGPNASLSVQEDGTATITFTAADPADTNFTWSIIDDGNAIGNATLGTASGNTQEVIYTANPNLNGLDEFTIQVSDGVDTSTSTVIVGVNPVNDAPINLTITPTPAGPINEGTQITLDGSFFDADNSTDPVLDDVHTVTIDWGDGTPVTVLEDAALTGTTTDTISFAGVTHTYVDEGETGVYTITVTATDEAGTSVTTTQDIEVNNVAPVIQDPDLTADPANDTAEQTTITVAEDGALTFELTATDAGIEDVLNWSVIGPAGSGTVTLNPSTTNGVQSFTYTPNLDFGGLLTGPPDDQFTIQVSDGDGGTDTIEVLVDVVEVNDPPEIIVNQFNITEGEELPIDISILDAVDIETLDDTQIGFEITNLAAGDTFKVNGVADNTFTRDDILNGLVTFQDNGDEVAPSFTITVTDNDPNGAAQVSEQANIFSFTTVNDAPEIIVSNSFTVAEGGTVPIRATNINATDEELNDLDLEFTASNLVAGTFLVGGTPQNTFTLRQINQGAVRFRHDGSETPPTFTLTVSDGEATDTFEYTPGFSPVNDAPQFLANALTIEEGGEVVLTTAELNATDIETLDNNLEFAISNLVGGTFLRNGVAIDVTTETFTLEEILLRAIAFEHDGTETAPSYTVTVSDNGTPAQSTTDAADITFTAVNDAPELTIDPAIETFTVQEGGTTLITLADINASDLDNPQSDLSFTVSNVEGGYFAQIGDTTTAITNFGWQQVDQRQVVFVHDGTDTIPTYTLTVSDPDGATDTDNYTATLVPVNDEPIVTTNVIPLTEDSSVVIDSSILSATDEESVASELTYTVDTTQLVGGQFEFVSNPGVAITAFNQAQVDAGEVIFNDNDTDELPPEFTLTLQDGTIPDGQGGTLAANSITLTEADFGIDYTTVNDVPTFATFAFPTVTEGGTIAIDNTILSATDEETLDSNLVYTVSTTVGSFQVNGEDATSFTQAQVDAGNVVTYVHDGSEVGPTITVSVSDNGTPVGVVEQTVTPTFENLNDVPELLASALTISEGQTVTLTTENLSATDLETLAPNLQFNITGITNGFFNVEGADSFGEGQTSTTGSFVLRDIIEGRVSFTQDDSNDAPTFTVEVEDADGGITTPVDATINFTATNDAPELDPGITNPTFTVNEGGTFLLTTASLNATDEPGETPQAELQFSVTNVEGGFFARSTATTVPIATFSWDDVNQGRVVFTHDGSNTVPSYTLTVTDADGGTDTQDYQGAIDPVNDAPVVTTNVIPLTEDSSVVIDSSILSATDEESTAGQLLYTVDSVTGGRFEVVGTTGPATSFTQAQVDAGEVSLVDDDTDELPPEFTLTLEDSGIGGANVETVTLTEADFGIDYTTVNDVPTFATFAFPTVTEGGTIAIDNTILAATDEETLDSNLVYTVSTTVGSFQVNGEDATSFTQAQVDAGNVVTYVHDGSEVGPTITVSVSDNGTPVGVVEQTVTPTFENLNDVPELLASALTISEGQTVTLTTENLSATDLESFDPNLQFNITGITNGFFTVEGAGSFGVDPDDAAIPTTGSFELQDIIESRVSFTQDGSNDAPTFTVEVEDTGVPAGTGTDVAFTVPVDATIDFTATNDAPELTIPNAPTDPAPFTIEEGATLLLTTASIDATDEIGETPQEALQFTVSNVEGGFFAKSTATTVPITTFSWDDVSQGRLVFNHNGTNVPPSYTLTVADAEGATASKDYVAALLEENDAPSILVNKLTLTEGDTVQLSSTLLLASDEESTATNLTYEISNLVGGNFVIDGVATPLGNGDTFTQAQVNAGEVSFVHDGITEDADYSLTLTDGGIDDGTGTLINQETVGPDPADITFTAINDEPTLTINFPTVNEGATIPMTSAEIAATDQESGPSQLVYTVDAIANGAFLVNGEEKTTFTQADINAGTIVTFVHDGTENAPSFTLTLSDNGTPEANLLTEEIVPDFQLENDPPTFTANQLTPIEGELITLTAADLAAIDREDADTQLLFSIDPATVTDGEETLISGNKFFLNGVELAATDTFTIVQINAGLLTFQDDGDEFAPTYDVTVTDTDGESTTETATVNLTNFQVNDDPVIEVNIFDIEEGEFLILNDQVTNLLTTDAETTDPALLTYTISDVVGGTFLLNGLTPTTTFTQLQLNQKAIAFKQDGTSTEPSFTITVTDPDGGEATAAGGVNFTDLNDPPVAVDDSGDGFVTQEDTVLLTPSLVLNDTDEDGTPLTVAQVNGGNPLASGAIATINGNSISYDPNGQFDSLAVGETTTDTFTYTVTDNDPRGALTDEATVTVVIEGVNDAPVAGADDQLTPAFTTTENAIIVLDVLQNDTDVDTSDVLSISSVDTTGAVGQITNDGTSLTYDPSVIQGLGAGATIVDTFTYTVSDGNGGTDTAIVQVEVTGVNDAPTAVDDSGEEFTTPDDTQPFTTLVALTANDIDEDEDPLRIIKINEATDLTVPIALASGSTITVNADNTVTYTPAADLESLSAGEVLQESFDYTITDDNGGQSTATATIVVTGTNAAPIASDDLLPGFATNENTPVTLTVLDNDADVDAGDTLTISEVDLTGVLGEVTNNGDTLTYDPSTTLNGLKQGETITETFSYTVSDGNGGTDTASVSVVVTGINDAPIAVKDGGVGFTTDEDTVFTTANVLLNDTDPDGDPLTITSIDTSQTTGRVTDNGNGTFTYDPTGLFDRLQPTEVARDTFTYTVSDGNGGTSVATVTIDVTGVIETSNSFFDLARSVRYDGTALVAPANTIDGIPLAQLFDESFYLAQNRDVAVAAQLGQTTAFQHFLDFGITEGRDPSILFDEDFYLANNPDVAASVASPDGFSSGLEHFLIVGHEDGRDPSSLFSQDDYLANNADVAAVISPDGIRSAFEHYILFGSDEDRLPELALYNETFYLNNNPDVAALVGPGLAFADGFQHFVSFGQTEGRAPSSIYNEESYLALNPDVANAVTAGQFVSGFQHYESFGRFEGREVF